MTGGTALVHSVSFLGIIFRRIISRLFILFSFFMEELTVFSPSFFLLWQNILDLRS